MKNKAVIGSIVFASALGATILSIPEERPVRDDAKGSPLTMLVSDTAQDQIDAFAFGTLCFRDIDTNKDGQGDYRQWGWSIGPLTELSYPYSFPLYAGASNCEVSRGALVGAVDLMYDGQTATLAYSTIPGYSLDEVHLYIGTEMLARDPAGRFTVTPDQFPVSADVGGDGSKSVHRVTGLSGEIYVVAHAFVSGAD